MQPGARKHDRMREIKEGKVNMQGMIVATQGDYNILLTLCLLEDTESILGSLEKLAVSHFIHIIQVQRGQSHCFPGRNYSTNLISSLAHLLCSQTLLLTVCDTLYPQQSNKIH